MPLALSGGMALNRVATLVGVWLALGSNTRLAQAAPEVESPPPYDGAAPTRPKDVPARPVTVPIDAETVPARPEALPSRQEFDPSDEPPRVGARMSPVPATTSYSGQIVVADLIGGTLVAMMITGAIDDHEALVLPWLLVSPIIHGAHGNPGRLGLSLLLHLGAPLTGAVLGLAMSLDCDLNCAAGGAGVGVILGAVAATAIDAAVLARDVPVPTPAAASSLPGGVQFVPTLSMARSGGGVVGLAGRF